MLHSVVQQMTKRCSSPGSFQISEGCEGREFPKLLHHQPVLMAFTLLPKLVAGLTGLRSRSYFKTLVISADTVVSWGGGVGGPGRLIQPR